MALLGIDIGGTKIAVCIGDDEGRLIEKQRIPTQAGDGPDQAIARILEVARPFCAKYAPKAVGLCSPGPISYAEGRMLTPPNLPKWHGCLIRDQIGGALALPIEMNNDGNACVLAEHHFGEHKGRKNMVYLTMSTGVGGGIISGGQLVQGVSDTGGEVGHMVLDIEGPSCLCGQRGCFEAYCGGGPLSIRIQKEIVEEGINTSMVQEAGSVENISMETLAKCARDGDPYALDHWNHFSERLAQGIGSIIQILNPEVIVLGTIAIHEGAFLMDRVEKALPKYCWKHPLEHTTITPSTIEFMGPISSLALSKLAWLRHQSGV